MTPDYFAGGGLGGGTFGIGGVCLGSGNRRSMSFSGGRLGWECLGSDMMQPHP